MLCATPSWKAPWYVALGRGLDFCPRLAVNTRSACTFSSPLQEDWVIDNVCPATGSKQSVRGGGGGAQHLWACASSSRCPAQLPDAKRSRARKHSLELCGMPAIHTMCMLHTGRPLSTQCADIVNGVAGHAGAGLLIGQEPAPGDQERAGLRERLRDDAIRAELDLPDFLEDFAGDHDKMAVGRG